VPDPIPPPPAPESLDRDLGLGGRILDQQRARVLNRDGSFNVKRAGLPGWHTEDVYHHILTIPWWQFHGLVVFGYFLANLLFGLAYFLCGPAALAGGEPNPTPLARFGECFFFSVQTLGTIGYGKLTPNTLGANLLVTLEAITGLMSFALATGLLFARFSRPTARLLFSQHALVSPFQEGEALMFRVMNGRVASELTEVHATVTFSRMEDRYGRRVRRFYALPLEREQVNFLPMQWVVVHPLDRSSPLRGLTREDLHASEAEILILITAVDETFAQTVHTRTSYRYDEVIWNARFRDMYEFTSRGTVVNARRLSEYTELR